MRAHVDELAHSWHEEGQAPVQPALLGIATGAFVDERDDWQASIRRAHAEGWRSLELTAITEERFRALATLIADRGLLDGFARVSLHAPARFGAPAADLAPMLDLFPYDLILHPDLWVQVDGVARLGRRAVFENMDVAKSFGRGVADLREVFGLFPEAGFCLDVAHVWTNDRTLRLGHELLDELGDRLRQLHVSGIEPDGTHRPTTQRDLDLYAPLLERCRSFPWVLEAVLAEDARCLP
jgi:hypothetical protein